MMDLEGLTKEIKGYESKGCLDKFNLGRCLAEVKGALEEREYKEWLRENFNFSSKSAEECILLYTTYGMDCKWKSLGTGRLLKIAKIGDITRIEKFIKKYSSELTSIRNKELVALIDEFISADEEGDDKLVDEVVIEDYGQAEIVPEPIVESQVSDSEKDGVDMY